MTTRTQGKLSLTFYDHAEKASNFEMAVDGGDILTELDGGTAAVTALAVAISALSEGFGARKSLQMNEDIFPLVYPASDTAFNKSKIAITCQDVVLGRIYTYTVPARNAAAFNAYVGSNKINMTDPGTGGTAQVVAAKAAIELTGRSPLNNHFSVLEMRVEG